MSSQRLGKEAQSHNYTPQPCSKSVVFTIRIFGGGHFDDEGNNYIGGFEQCIADVDTDRVSLKWLNDMFRVAIGLKGRLASWFLDPRRGLRSLMTDVDIIRMINCAYENPVIEVYIVKLSANEEDEKNEGQPETIMLSSDEEEPVEECEEDIIHNPEEILMLEWRTQSEGKNKNKRIKMVSKRRWLKRKKISKDKVPVTVPNEEESVPNDKPEEEANEDSVLCEGPIEDSVPNEGPIEDSVLNDANEDSVPNDANEDTVLNDANEDSVLNDANKVPVPNYANEVPVPNYANEEPDPVDQAEEEAVNQMFKFDWSNLFDWSDIAIEDPIMEVDQAEDPIMEDDQAVENEGIEIANDQVEVADEDDVAVEEASQSDHEEEGVTQSLFDLNIGAEAEKGKKKRGPRKKKKFVIEEEKELFEEEDQFNSDDQRSICSNEDEADVYPEFKEDDLKDPNFRLGMRFANAEQFRKAVKEYGILHKKVIVFTKNEKWRVRAQCKGPCTWTIFASKMQKDDTLQVKTYHSQHSNCQPAYTNPNINSTWLAKKYKSVVRFNPEIPLEAFQEMVKDAHSVDVSKSQVYRAKRKAMDVIDGDHSAQYGLLWRYCKELKRAMPGTNTVIKSIDGEDGPIFQRMYVCLGPLKKGLAAGCRPFIGIDACFLKGPYTGQLLAAVGIDGNNGMWPVAYAVVEKENKATWKWFLEILIQDLGIINPQNWTIMSDQQKGLIGAVREVIPEAEHRYCVRHIYSNLKKEHAGKLVKDAFWKCARATTPQYFNVCMEKLKAIKEGAWNWVTTKGPSPECWTKAHFREVCKSDLIINNHCEIFNNFILRARAKPIISMFECIRLMLMTRIRNCRDQMMKELDIGPLCPKIVDKLEEIREQAAGWICRWNGGNQYEVQGPVYQVVVDLEECTCACRLWELSGVPCRHAMCAILFRGWNPADFVHQCYTKEVYMKAYENILLPINGQELWPYSGKRPLKEPVITVQPGRKKTKRNKKNDEAPKTSGKMGRGIVILTCSVCGNTGHNKRSCKGQGTKKNKAGDKKKGSKKNDRSAGEGTSAGASNR